MLAIFACLIFVAIEYQQKCTNDENFPICSTETDCLCRWLYTKPGEVFNRNQVSLSACAMQLAADAMGEDADYEAVKSRVVQLGDILPRWEGKGEKRRRGGRERGRGRKRGEGVRKGVRQYSRKNR